jgi:hypothetical protein
MTRVDILHSLVLGRISYTEAVKRLVATGLTPTQASRYASGR